MLHFNSGRTDNIKKAEEAIGFKANTAISLLDEPMVPNDGKREYQRHIAIEWEGGVLWMTMYDFNDPADVPAEGAVDNRHYCIDVRQFNSAGKLKGEGVFTMAKQVDRGSIPDHPEGNVKGHNWNGGYVVAILTDPDGKETHTEDERE
jgi:hypothetical protein